MAEYGQVCLSEEINASKMLSKPDDRPSSKKQVVPKRNTHSNQVVVFFFSVKTINVVTLHRCRETSSRTVKIGVVSAPPSTVSWRKKKTHFLTSEKAAARMPFATSKATFEVQWRLKGDLTGRIHTCCLVFAPSLVFL